MQEVLPFNFAALNEQALHTVQETHSIPPQGSSVLQHGTEIKHKVTLASFNIRVKPL